MKVMTIIATKSVVCVIFLNVAIVIDHREAPGTVSFIPASGMYTVTGIVGLAKSQSADGSALQLVDLTCAPSTLLTFYEFIKNCKGQE